MPYYAAGNYVSPLVTQRVPAKIVFGTARMCVRSAVRVLPGRYAVSGAACQFSARHELSAVPFEIDASLRDFLDLVMLDALD